MTSFLRGRFWFCVFAAELLVLTGLEDFITRQRYPRMCHLLNKPWFLTDTCHRVAGFLLPPSRIDTLPFHNALQFIIWFSREVPMNYFFTYWLNYLKLDLFWLFLMTGCCCYDVRQGLKLWSQQEKMADQNRDEVLFLPKSVTKHDWVCEARVSPKAIFSAFPFLNLRFP